LLQLCERCDWRIANVTALAARIVSPQRRDTQQNE
jgi:hypothetical protein